MSRIKVVIWNKRDNREYLHMSYLALLLSEGHEVIGLFDYESPLSETIEKIKESDYFIGTDGFLLHLCNYLGKKGIAIWNCENFVKNFPHGGVIAVSSMADPEFIVGLFNKLYGDRND